MGRYGVGDLSLRINILLFMLLFKGRCGTIGIDRRCGTIGIDRRCGTIIKPSTRFSCSPEPYQVGGDYTANAGGYIIKKINGGRNNTGNAKPKRCKR